MSTFRHWVHEQLARLDGARERRFVALAAAFVFAILALGPTAIKAINNPSIQLDTPVIEMDRVRFLATLSVPLENFHFRVTASDGTATVLGAELPDPNDPLRRSSVPFPAAPGATYGIQAIGVYATATAPPQTITSAQQSFTMPQPDPTGSGTSATSGTSSTSGTSGTGTSDPVSGTASEPKIVELLQAVVVAAAVPHVEMRGRYSGFTADTSFFRIQNVTGLAFLGEYPADTVEDGIHRLVKPIPGGALYRVTFVAREGATFRSSGPIEVFVPAVEASTETTETTAEETQTANATQLPPPPPPEISLVLPFSGAELLSPVPLAARVLNATATRVVFEVLDPAGVTRTLDAGGGPTEWTAMFTGAAGQYAIGVRTFLLGGNVIPPSSPRPFRILAAATTTTATAPVADTGSAATTTATSEPFIELFSPAPDAAPFPGAVPISARVRNGVPEKVVSVVIGPDGRETIVIAAKSATGDFWTAIFDGPDGEYRYRVRALVAGREIFAPERRFAVKRPVTTAPTTTTTPLPPPPPPPSGTATATEPLPPPPPTAPLPVIAATDAASGTVTAPPPPLPVPEALAAECRVAGVLPARCADWLKARYQSRECLEAGAVTREACVELLQRLNVPADENALFGLARKEDIAQARQDARRLSGEAVRREDLPPSIAALLPPARDPEALVRVIPVANEREDSSPALLVIDTDGDRLPDDVERRFGTDPEAADTDGDGFKDGDEVRNGYNPLGAGTLASPVRGVEKALLEGLPLEEPRGAEISVDPAFTIEAAEPTDEAAETDEDVIRLSGVAAPNSVVTIFVYSYLPVVVTTTTDENGNWTYDFGSKLAEGRHEAYVSVNDDTGKLVASSSPLAFFVREAQAVSEEDFLRPDINVEEAPATLSRRFIWGGIALVAIALLLVIAIVRQTRKEPPIGSGEGL